MLARHPLNAVGDFYVMEGCCTACGKPEQEAPELFGWDDDQHCFVKRQPRTDSDLDHMINAMEAAELSCVRYCGKDAKVFDRLQERWCIDEADFAPARMRLRSTARRTWWKLKRLVHTRRGQSR